MKLILLTFGVVGLFAVSLFSFSHESFALTIISPDQGLRELKSSQTDETLQAPGQTTQKRDSMC